MEISLLRDRTALEAREMGWTDCRLSGKAFAPHRHDTYTIGVVGSGILGFQCRGTYWRCMPGQYFILQPDELHDGEAVTSTGVTLKIAHIDPCLLQAELGGRPLPQVEYPVPAAQSGNLQNRMGSEPFALPRTAGAVLALLMNVGNACLLSRSLGIEGLNRVRDRLCARPGQRCSMEELEALADMDRWTLARQFRAAFGTSPNRYRVLRQLDMTRRLLGSGSSIATAAADAGFADQSHMTRHFKRAYGMTPGSWLAAIARRDSRSWLQLP